MEDRLRGARKTTSDRLRSYLTELAHIYPYIWRQVDDFVAGKGKDLPAWASWCFLPLAAACAIATQGRNMERIDPEAMRSVGNHIGIIGGLTAWRPTQGIYQFHPEVYQAVLDTPLSGDLPVDLFYALPEWCVYISTPGMDSGQGELLGFFAYLEDDANKPEHHELRFVLDFGTFATLAPVGINLDSGTIQEAVDSFLMEGLQNLWRSRELQAAMSPGATQADAMETAREWTDKTRGKMAENLTPLISLVLYLCSINSDIRGPGGTDRLPTRPRPQKTKKGLRLFAPDNPALWDVGYRLGAALGRARQQATSSSPGAGTHASPEPHIRRAHWHAYWMGSRSQPDVRRRVAKWLPPIPVGVKDIDDLVPTFRDVE